MLSRAANPAGGGVGPPPSPPLPPVRVRILAITIPAKAPAPPTAASAVRPQERDLRDADSTPPTEKVRMERICSDPSAVSTRIVEIRRDTESLLARTTSPS